MGDTTFDYLDTFYLANNLSVPELRHEIHEADIQARVSELYLGTAFEYDECRFPWVDYSAVCRESITIIQEYTRQHPLPALPGKRIDIAGIKARNDIVTVAEGYTQLRKSGHNRFTGQCPLHEDRHPSLTVYADNQSWHCFQCNKGGDVFDFIMAVNTCDFKQAAAILGGT
jgi:hypothetical protein